MISSSGFGAGEDNELEVLWADGDRLFCKRWRDSANGDRHAVLVVLPATKRATPDTVKRIAHEYRLKDELDGAWAVRPLDLVREHGRIALVMEFHEGAPLGRIIGSPMEVGSFLRIAISLSAVVGRLHENGLIHKDIKPANVLLDSVTGELRLMGFGIASRLPRERQPPKPPEFIAGTLAYMAPEQTGHMNRSIDSRSDLYALGVTFYEMLTGSLPFTASDPMGWVHCHIARQPVPPDERLPAIPGVVSAIIMKLLAKTPDDRYQTAAGVESDLRRCLVDWEGEGQIAAFVPGLNDMPGQLSVPESLYGRAREIETLTASFDRIVAGGRPELVLVSGYSGIGKSSVVNELHKVLVPPRGLFAWGKFDQHKRNIPYSTLAQAFQGLIRPLLGKNEAELQSWRDALHEALGANGALIVDLIPDLKFIIGEQPQVAELSPRDAQQRFHLVFRRFIGVFANVEHPLALFLDDLQWLDVATLDVLEDLVTQPDVQQLMLIGAYRDNEVGSDHPLVRKLEKIRWAGGKVQEIVLAPLARGDVAQLIVDALRSDPERARLLAKLVHEKTGGNPFFVIQFLHMLGEEGLLTFDYRNSRWSWDLNRIYAKAYTDNVVELLVKKLHRLPWKTRKALQQLACLGDSAEFALLTMVYESTDDEMHCDLRVAVRAGLVVHSERYYRFLHDRVREAAYSLIPKDKRAAAHLRIGRLLVARGSSTEIEENIFEIVNQLNRGSRFTTSDEERHQIVTLNIVASRRAKASTAYASALSYATTARMLLIEKSWPNSYDLVFSAEYLIAECELLTSNLGAAEKRLSRLAQCAKSDHDAALVAHLRVILYTTLDRSDRAVEVCLEYLRRGGTDWPLHPTNHEVQREYERILSLVGRRKIEELVDLPLTTNADILDALGVLAEVVTPALFYDEHLSSLVICRMVNLSLEHGNSDGACVAYVRFAMIAGPRFGNYKAGAQFGRLGYDLVERRGLKQFQARTYMCFGNIVLPWTRHVHAGSDLVRRAFDVANETGDFTFAAYSCNQLITNLLAGGAQLEELQREAEAGLEFAKKLRFGLVVDVISSQLGLIRTLRGLTRKFGSFDSEEFDEARMECHLASNPVLAEAECWYSVRKLQARFFAGDYASAINASLTAKQLLWTSPSQFETAEFHFYSALSNAASWESASADQRQQHFEALAAHHRQLELWAENCPDNFDDRAALVGAEIARIEGRELDAQRLYEQAIRSARANGFLHNEAVANEVAARFYAARGFETIAHAYLRAARYGYVRWGASAKVRQLDALYPHLSEERPIASLTSTIEAPVEQLDLATVIKVSQAVSSEIVLEKLVDTLMRTAIEHAGAQRGLLILPRDDGYRMEAEATTSKDMVTVVLRQTGVTGADLPESVFRCVVRTNERVILHDAAGDAQFSTDQYINGHRSRSILCLPLLKQSRLVGVLYLENNLAPHVFTPARIAVLTLLASEAAISLENIRLYSDLQEREAKIRRLVESNIIGIFTWGPDGRIVDANRAFLRIVQYERDDLISGRLGWRELTPSDWRAADDRRTAELNATGIAQPYEKEYLRKDGNRVPVLVGAAMLEGRTDEGVGFVLDLTNQKRAEEAVRESERRFREAQMELAHANRVATMGQLSASIAHEINQPISAAVTYSDAALRWLRAEPPNLDEIRQALGLILESGIRAGDIMNRIRSLVKKAPPRMDSLGINELILEVVALTRAEMAKNAISVKTELAEGLPPVQGDRVQLQQVLLNLLINAAEAMSGENESARQLLISTERSDTDVLVAVRDSGPGLPPESVDRLFEAFYTTKPGGLGMGLSICRSIIEAHEGRLWATAGVPQGAAFQFTLPAYSSDGGRRPRPD